MSDRHESALPYHYLTREQRDEWWEHNENRQGPAWMWSALMHMRKHAEAVDTVIAERDRLRIGLENCRVSSKRFTRRCDKCSSACQCVAKLNTEIQRMVADVIGPPSILRGTDDVR